MSEYEVLKPKLEEMIAIRDRNYEQYSVPVYQHYNWCLDYLGSFLPRVLDPYILPDEVTFNNIQNIMIKACTRYLKPRIWYDAPNGLWMCKSVDSPYNYYGSSAKQCYERNLKRATYASIAKNAVKQMKLGHENVRDSSNGLSKIYRRALKKLGGLK